MDCARAFGACVEMRDEPLGARIPNKFKPSNYHLEQLEEARQILQGAKMLSNDEAFIDAERLYDETLQGYANLLNSTATTAKRYIGMRAKVKKWKAPTSKHTNFREFMISQLEQSIDFDCSVSHTEVPKRIKPQEYKNMLIKESKRNIEYHTQAYKKEVKSAQLRTEWVMQLRRSLPKK